MARATNHVVLNLTTLHWLGFPEGSIPPPRISVVLWPVLVKIDGNTAHVTAQTALAGSCTVTGTTGVGSIGDLRANGSISISPVIGQFATAIRPIAVDLSLQSLAGPNVPGIVGLLAVVIDRRGLEADALIAGHAALKDAVETAVNNLIPTFNFGHQQITSDDIKSLVNQVQTKVENTIRQHLDGWLDSINALFRSGTIGTAVFTFAQDDFPKDLMEKAFSNTLAHIDGGAVGIDGNISLAPAKDGRISLDRAIKSATLTGEIALLLT